MKLLHKEYGFELDIFENSISVLIIENAVAYAKIINDLWKQSNGDEGGFSLLEDDKTRSIAKDVECIINPFALSCNNKKIITKLYHELKDIALDKMQQETIDLNANLVSYIENLTQTVPYPINFHLDFDVSAILKSYNVILTEEYESLLEKIIEYIKVCRHICNIGIYFFVNLKCFLSEKEIFDLYEFAFYEKIKIVLFESIPNKTMDDEKVWILDQDLCIITL